MLTESIDQRLHWFKSVCCQVSDQQVIVKEDNPDGKANLVCHVGNYSILFDVEKFVPPFFKNRTPKSMEKLDSNIQCVDGIIFERIDDGDWQVHIIECKKSVNTPDRWEHVKEQFEAALLIAHSLIGVLGIQVSQIKCYTARRTDKLEDWVHANPLLGKPELGGEVKFNPALDWTEDTITVLSLKVPHQKIDLDDEGNGEVTLG